MRRGILFLLIAGLLLILGGRHFFNAPVNPKNAQSVSVDIPAGLGARAIAQKLSDAGVLRSPTGFVLLVVLRGARDTLRAGTYEFSPKESGQEIIGRLVRGDTLPADASVTFPEGFTLQQIAARISARGLAPEDEFLKAAKVGRFRGEFAFLKDAPETASLEGYLFPDTYRFHRGQSPDEIVKKLLRRFDEQYRQASQDSALTTHNSQLTTHDIVTMASIIEREVQSPEDRRRVSGILWKRFEAGIGLEADATVRYALGDWDKPLTVDDLRTDSPYNTRRYRGLPPGPIGNPGLDSLKAAFSPTPSEYLYYLSAAEDRRTIFSRTLEEHNKAKAEHL